MQNDEHSPWSDSDLSGPVVDFTVSDPLLCERCREEYQPTLGDMAEIYEADATGRRPVFHCPRCRPLPDA